MKIAYLILTTATLITLSANAQNYDFDLLAQYRVNVNNYKHDRITYANSKDDSYFLSVSPNSGKLKGVIYDLKKFIMYNYSVNESKIQGELYFDFVYVDSIPIKYHKSFYEYEFTKEEVKIDSASKTMIVNAYLGIKRKRPKMSLKMNMIETKDNLFPLFRFSCFHPFELLYNLNFPGNYLVKKSKGISLTGKSVQHELIEFKEVKLNLQIPKI